MPILTPTRLKRATAAIHDVMMAGLAIYVSLLLRYGVADMPPFSKVLLPVLVFSGVALVTFWVFRLGRGIWRFASLTDLKAIVSATTVTVLAFFVCMFLFNRLDNVPRSTILIAWFVLIIFLAGPRLIYRIIRDGGVKAITGQMGKERRARTRILLVGSAMDCDHVIRTFQLENSDTYRVLGIIDLKDKSIGRQVRGIPILSGVNAVEQELERLTEQGRAPNAFVIAAPRENRDALQAIMNVAAPRGIAIARVGQASPLMGREPTLEAITLDDLLGRPPVKLNLARINDLVSGKVVLVTGAGGSIGSEIVRQVASYAPARLVMFDHGEFNLYQIDQEISQRQPRLTRVPVIGCVRDRDAIMRLLAKEKPDVVFHAAALKHVPLVEANPGEGVLTNVTGTCNVADAAVASGAQAVVMISTDKAIRPTSIMGATKRVAETYCQHLDVSQSGTRFITVRFGNVLGSTGSVVPLFEKQIRAGGPVTVTHPDMRRYFMTIREATELVLQAAARGLTKAEERGRICVLDMGDPVRIVDLARTMIALAGRRPDIDIPIVFTGLRPGEKLFEELFDEAESTEATDTDGVMVASPRMLDPAKLMATLEKLTARALAGDHAACRRLLSDLVPELPGDSQQAPYEAAV